MTSAVGTNHRRGSIAGRDQHPPTTRSASGGSPGRVDRTELDRIGELVGLGAMGAVFATASSSSTFGRAVFGGSMGIAAGMLAGTAGAFLVGD